MGLNELEAAEKSPTSESAPFIFDLAIEMGHEQVVFCNDPSTGLKSIIAIHSTTLGPSMGGVRMWDYASDQEALTDVMRLSRAMTFKAAISGLNAGGGKAVIIGDASTHKDEILMRRFGQFVDGLGGRYVTTEDVGMTTQDMRYIGMETSYVTGLPHSMGGGGDPSPVTAFGTYMGMKAAAHRVFGSDNLENRKISVQGTGSVGSHLVELLVKENATVFASDISPGKLQAVAKMPGVTVVEADELYDLDVDIYSPCALGATLNDGTIKRLKSRIIAGGANNQLMEEDRHGRMLMDRGIVYCPDFLINAGGIINVYLEYLGDYKSEEAYQKVEGIYDTCLAILEKSEVENITPQNAAIEVAMKRINAPK